MEFNQIESFLTVVKYKSFSRAAKELFLTQPTISNNIQSLENELATILLNRTSKAISLTDSGKIFYKYARELVNLRDKAKFEIKEQGQNIQGQIELLASSIPEQYVLPYIIRDFTSLFPEITFNVSQKNSKDIIHDIINGRESFGIVGAKIDSRKLGYIDFYQDELVLAVPNSKDFSNLDNILNIDFLFSQKFIFRRENSGTRIFLEKCLSQANVNIDDLNIVSQLDSNEMIKKMIELGQGVSFLSKISITNELDLGLIRAFEVPSLKLKRNFYFVYSKYITLAPNVERFRDFLLDL